MGIEHSFDTALAKEHGVHPAILIKNFQFWLIKNKANGKHQHDGYTWTYNSVQAYKTIFPYLSAEQIKYALQKLVEKGILIKGNYSDDKRDRSSWYAFADENLFLTENPLCIRENSQMQLSNFPNDIDTDNKHTDTKKTKQKKLLGIDAWEAKNGEVTIESLEPWFSKNKLCKYKTQEALDNFRNQCAAKGYEYKSFPAAFKTWYQAAKINTLKPDNADLTPTARVEAEVKREVFTI